MMISLASPAALVRRRWPAFMTTNTERGLTMMKSLAATLALSLLATGQFGGHAGLAFGQGRETPSSGHPGTQTIVVKLRPQPHPHTQSIAAQPLDQVTDLLGGDPKSNSRIRFGPLATDAGDSDLYYLSIENARTGEVEQLLERLNSLEVVESADPQLPPEAIGQVEMASLSPSSNPNYYLDSVSGTKGFMLKYLPFPPTINFCSSSSPGVVFWASKWSTVFEPASTIKILHHVHAMLQVQNGPPQLTDMVPVPILQDGSCPISFWTLDEQLETVLSKMMWQSDNRRTDAVRARFGQGAINATAQSLGMNNTLLQHKPGCGLPHNQLTLTDAGKIYEQAFTGDLFTAANRAKLNELMPNLLGELNDLIPWEAVFTHQMAVPQEFWDNLKVANKAGGYTLWEDGGWKIYRSIAGYVELPVRVTCLGKPAIRKRRYVYGVFIDKSASPESDVNDAFSQAITELWRQAVRDALATFK